MIEIQLNNNTEKGYQKLSTISSVTFQDAEISWKTSWDLFLGQHSTNDSFNNIEYKDLGTLFHSELIDLENNVISFICTYVYQKWGNRELLGGGD